MVEVKNNFASQWYLGTGVAGGITLNLGDVWSQTGGQGVDIAIVDDGIEAGHDKLAAATSGAAQYNAAGAPTSESAGHGTAVAGVIGASPETTGVVGIAPGAALSSVRVFGEGGLSIADALGQLASHDVANNSWGYSYGFYLADQRDVAGGTWGALDAALETAIDFGRDGLGTIVVKASGNAREDGRMATDDGVSSFHGTIVVGAVDHTGTVAYYSTPGSNVLVSTPSSGAGQYVTTTDRSGSAGYRDGDIHDGFGGTSAATPMVSATAALMLEANATLHWSEVQDILALSARHVGSAIGTAPTGNEHFAWATNAASHWNGGGLHFSNDYGFGLLDAHAAVRLAESWDIGRDGSVLETRAVAASADAAGNASFVVDVGLDLAAVTLTLDTRVSIESIDRVVLTSAGGTESILWAGGDAAQNWGSFSWDFVSQAFRGEAAQGTWSLRVEGANGPVNATLEIDGTAASDNDVFTFTNEYGIHGAATITDAAGADTINTAAMSGSVAIDLTPGATSTLAGAPLTIAAGTVIETVVTGDGDDTVTGNAAANTIWTGRGTDHVFAGAGDDTLYDHRGADAYDGGAGHDTLVVREAYDADAMSFARDASGAIAFSHGGETDTLTGIEAITFADGTAFAFGPDTGSAVTLLGIDPHADGF